MMGPVTRELAALVREQHRAAAPRGSTESRARRASTATSYARPDPIHQHILRSIAQ
jgi:hypothetical protein